MIASMLASTHPLSPHTVSRYVTRPSFFPHPHPPKNPPSLDALSLPPALCLFRMSISRSPSMISLVIVTTPKRGSTALVLTQ